MALLDKKTFPAQGYNPDEVGYPHEQEDWWKYIDADEEEQARLAELNQTNTLNDYDN